MKFYPGAVCKVGETFDFESFYARKALAEGTDVSRFGNILISLDPALLEKVKLEISN